MIKRVSLLPIILAIISSSCVNDFQDEALERNSYKQTTLFSAESSSAEITPSPISPSRPKPIATSTTLPYLLSSFSDERIRVEGTITLEETEIISKSYTPDPEHPYVPASAWVSANLQSSFVDLDDGIPVKSDRSDLQFVLTSGSDTFFYFEIPNKTGSLKGINHHEAGKEDCLLELYSIKEQLGADNRYQFEWVELNQTYCLITSDGRLSIVDVLDLGWTDEGIAFVTIDFIVWEEIILQTVAPAK
jgi:hypothetical protein